MSMHLLPVYWTTTNTRKHKKGKKSKSLLAAEIQHKKFLKKMGVGESSSIERAPDMQSDDSTHSQQEDPFPLSNTIPVGLTPKKEVVEHNFTIALAYNKGSYQVISKNNIKDIGK